jgi:nucleoid-associated protein YgaU
MKMNFRNEVSAALKEIESILILKNEKYGNSALEPLGVFSQLSAKEGLLVRIDDKLKRIKNGSLEKDDEDVINDLIGYLVLLKIHTNAEKGNEGPKGVTLVNGKIDINEFF